MRFVGKAVRALIALAVLAGLVVGLPAALAAFGTSPVRGRLSGDALRDALAEPTSDRVVAGLLTAAAWLVWALFLRALVVELAAARRLRHNVAAAATAPLPAGRVGPLRWVARSLVLWLSMTAGSFGSLAGATTAPSLTTVLAVDHTEPAEAAVPTPTPAPAPLAEPEAPSGQRVVVQEATDAWTLAERHLGSGLRWQELWTHNRDHIQPNGRRWADAESTIEAGWEIYLPGTATATAAPPTPAESAGPPAAEVQVHGGDDFWRLAEQHLATSWGRAPNPAEVAPYWRQMIDANRDRLAPPGDPNLIFPGQTFVFPALGPDPTTASAPAALPAAPAQRPGPDTPSSTASVPSEAGAPSGSTPSTAPSEAAAPTSAPTSSVPAPTAPAEPATSPADAPVTTTTAGDHQPRPEGSGSSTSTSPAEHAWPVGLAGGGIALAGAVVLLERRRRAQQRHRPRGQRLPAPPPGMERAENELRAGVDVTGARLVDVALRAAAAGAGTTGLPTQRWVETDTDSVLLVLATPSTPPRGFIAEGPDRWRTDASSDVLTGRAAPVASPAPTLVPVGVTPTGAEVLIDLESSGVVTVSGPAEITVGFLRGLAAAVATVPWNTQPEVVLAGMSGELCALPWVNASASLGDALAAAESRMSRATAALRVLDCRTAGHARASGEVPDSWDPLVVISAQHPHELDDRRLSGLAARPHHAVAVVTPPGTVPPQGRAFNLDHTGRLRIDGVEPVVQARLLDDSDARVVVEMLEQATRLDTAVPAPALTDDAVRGAPQRDQPAADAPTVRRLDVMMAQVEVLVRVLGEIDVARLTPAGEEPLTAERQKGLEALVYMSLRESAVDRDDLEATLFPTGANALKTFHNTMSAARRTVGEDLLPHSNSGRYELSERVVTDYGLFCDLVAEAEDTEDAETAAALLREALGPGHRAGHHTGRRPPVAGLRGRPPPASRPLGDHLNIWRPRAQRHRPRPGRRAAHGATGAGRVLDDHFIRVRTGRLTGRAVARRRSTTRENCRDRHPQQPHRPGRGSRRGRHRSDGDRVRGGRVGPHQVRGSDRRCCRVGRRRGLGCEQHRLRPAEGRPGHPRRRRPGPPRAQWGGPGGGGTRCLRTGRSPSAAPATPTPAATRWCWGRSAAGPRRSR